MSIGIQESEHQKRDKQNHEQEFENLNNNNATETYNRNVSLNNCFTIPKIATMTTCSTTVTTVSAHINVQPNTTYANNYSCTDTTQSILTSEVDIKRNTINRHRKIISDVIRCVLFLVSLGK